VDRSGVAKWCVADILDKYFAYAAIFIRVPLDDDDRRFSDRDTIFFPVVGLWDIWIANWTVTKIPR
jgi:hypothetical protein